MSETATDPVTEPVTADAPTDGAPLDGPRRGEELRGYLRVTAVASVVIAACLVGATLRSAETVFRPFVVALFLCILVRPIVAFFARRAGSRSLGYVLSLLVVFGTIYTGGRIVANAVTEFNANRAGYLENLNGYYDWLIDKLGVSEAETSGGAAASPDDGTDVAGSGDPVDASADDETGDEGEEAPSWLATIAVPNRETVAGMISLDRVALVVGFGTTAFLGFVGELLVILVFMTMILLELDRLPARIRRAFGEEKAARIQGAVDRVDDDVQRYVATKVLLSVLTAGAAGVVMALFGVDYLLLFTIVAFAFNFIPYIGSLIATVAPVLVALLQFPAPWRALWLAVVLTVVQQLIGNVVEPRVQGKGLQLSPVVILFSLAFWGWLWGITGMILAVPFAVTLRIVLGQIEGTRTIAIMMTDPGTDGSGDPGEAVEPPGATAGEAAVETEATGANGSSAPASA